MQKYRGYRFPKTSFVLELLLTGGGGSFLVAVAWIPERVEGGPSFRAVLALAGIWFLLYFARRLQSPVRVSVDAHGVTCVAHYLSNTTTQWSIAELELRPRSVLDRLEPSREVGARSGEMAFRLFSVVPGAEDLVGRIRDLTRESS